MRYVKKITIVLGILVFIVLLATAGGYFWFQEQNKPVAKDATVADFLITKGTNVEKVGQDLYKKGFIRSPLAFKLYIQLTDSTKKVQAGEFRLSPSYSMLQIIDTLSKGPIELWVTVPEGLRREEVVEKVIAGLNLQGEVVQEFRAEFIAQTKDLEGQLFPDTYLFPKDATPPRVIKVMQDTFNKKYIEVENEKTSKLTKKEIIVLASVVQREAITPSDMQGAASTFLNRLEIGMTLGSDVTVEYALGFQKDTNTWWKKDLTADDLAIKSPYNTRANSGLPPTPICNPGLVALKAAANPLKTDYLYFLSDTDGKLHFAKTLSEHNENVRKYLEK